MQMAMRNLLIFAALLPLAACATLRQGLGDYQKAADQGFEVSIGDSGPAPTPAAEPVKSPPVPTALIGDTVHRKYTTDAPGPPK